MEVISATRVFKTSVQTFPDPDPALSPEDVLKVYARNFPSLANASLGAPRIQGNEAIYEIQMPPVKTKG
ncbi:MAG: PRTRC system protein C [Candidatus Methylumidiphilus sp.]